MAHLKRRQYIRALCLRNCFPTLPYLPGQDLNAPASFLEALRGLL